MKVLRLPLVGSVVNRNLNPASFSAKDQLFINGYPEVVQNAITGQSRVYLNKRPGSTKGSALSGVTGAGTMGAMVAWTGNSAPQSPLAAAFINTGATSTSVWDIVNDGKIGGDISTTSDCLCLTETSVSGTANLVGYFSNSGTGATEQWFFPEGGSWTKVSDADFPSTIIGSPCHMDGFVFNMTREGNLWNSDINSVSSYTAGNYIATNIYPDHGVSVARSNDLVVAFGETSIELFRNNGNATGSPLARAGTLQMGAARRLASDPQTVFTAHGAVWFMATNTEGASIGVYKFSGSTPEKVSPPSIDKLLASGGAILGFVGSLTLHGLRHVVMRGSSGVWAFCVDNGFWWKVLLPSGEMRGCCGLSNAGNGPEQVSYFIGTNNARSNLLTTVYQDDSVAYTLTVRTEKVDGDTDAMKFWKKLRVIADTQSSTSNLAVSYSDDDFGTFSTPVNIDLSGTQNWITSLGASRRRSWQFTHSSNTPFRGEAVEIHYEVGNQ